MLCHAFPPLFFKKMFIVARTDPSAAGSNAHQYAAPAFESWQAELALPNSYDRNATAACRSAKRIDESADSIFKQPGPSTHSVIAGHSRPKDGVASARLCPAIHLLRKWSCEE
jgi:hypothetical protein